MTAERSGTGTATYRPPVAGAGLDVFGLANPAQRVYATQRRLPPRFTVSKLTDDLYYWRVELRSAVGGLGKVLRGNFDEVHDYLESSTLDSRFGLVLPQLTTVAATPDPGATNLILTHANVFNTLVMGIGNTNNSAIFRETDDDPPDPTVIAITHTITSEVVSLTPVRLNGVQTLIVGRRAAVARAWSDLTPTSTDMHADTAALWGAIQTPINSESILLYTGVVNGAILTLAATAAYGTQPTSALTGIPNGGYAIGLLSLAGGPMRAYWVWPRHSLFSVPLLAFGSESYGNIMSTNLQGTDPQQLKLPLKGVKFASLWNDGIVASDGERIIFHNGRVIQDMRIFANRAADPDKVYRVRGFFINGPELMALVQKTISTGGTGNTVQWTEAYIPHLDAWVPVTGQTTLSTTGLLGVAGAPSLPVSDATGFAHQYADGSWRRFRAVTPGVDPYTLRKIDGAAATTGITYASSGAATWPAFQIPGLEGWPISVRRISGNPQIDIGGGTPTTNPSVGVTVGGVTATFVYGETQGRQEFGFWQNDHFVYELQPVITLTQQAGGTDPTRTTPQAFPIVVEGIASRPRFEAGSAPMDYTR